ncbi:cysteine hydrolase [Pseudonocardia ailaonensis]|uniref:Cysteine hydrolase n=1 Tax=Pseudonocardia ailaonensis TaxID=367279 RepID=A0ABN2N1Q6_9PSEU
MTSGPTRQHPAPAPATTAVLVVECQNGVLGPEAALPALAADAAPAIGDLERLLHGARAAGVLVVHATAVGALSPDDVGTTPLLRSLRTVNGDWHAGHPATQVLPRLLAPTDVVLPRHLGLSPTTHTEVLPMLRARGIETIVLAGVSLNVALVLAAGDATQRGFRVVVPRDAVVGTPAEYGEQMLRNTFAMLARITGVDDLLAGWAE